MPKSSWRMKGGNGWQIPRPNQAWILSSSQASRWPLICSMTWWKHNSNSPVPLQADMSLIFFGKPLHHCKGSRSPKWWCKASTCPWHKSGCQWTRNFQSREIKWQPAFTLPTLVYTNKHLHQLLQKKQKQLKCFDQGPNPQLSNLLLQPTVAGGLAWRQTNIDNISMVSVVRHTHLTWPWVLLVIPPSQFSPSCTRARELRHPRLACKAMNQELNQIQSAKLTRLSFTQHYYSLHENDTAQGRPVFQSNIKFLKF